MAMIHSLVVDSDSSTECHLFTSETARDAFADDLCFRAWAKDGDGGPYPTGDWRAAWEVISESANWWLAEDDHDMPDLQLVSPEVSI